MNESNNRFVPMKEKTVVMNQVDIVKLRKDLMGIFKEVIHALVKLRSIIKRAGMNFKQELMITELYTNKDSKLQLSLCSAMFPIFLAILKFCTDQDRSVIQLRLSVGSNALVSILFRYISNLSLHG